MADKTPIHILLTSNVLTMTQWECKADTLTPNVCCLKLWARQIQIEKHIGIFYKSRP